MKAAQTWQHMSARERRMVTLAVVVVLVAAGWGLGVAPALRVLRNAPAQIDTLDQQLQTMQLLAAEAASIQTRPPLARDAAVRALEASVRQRLGAQTQLRVVGDRATVQLQAASPTAVSQWLAQVRVATRAVPSQVQIQRSERGWDGSIVLDLPPA